jgi:hypothetical protein
MRPDSPARRGAMEAGEELRAPRHRARARGIIPVWTTRILSCRQWRSRAKSRPSKTASTMNLSKDSGRAAFGTTRPNDSRWNVSAGKSNAEHRRHNGRARTIGQLCCSIARKRVRYLRRCRAAGTTRTRSRPAVLRGPGATRPRSSPPLIYAARRKPWLASPRTRTSARRPSGRRARGKTAAASNRPSDTLRRSAGAPRKWGREANQTNNNKHTPVAAGVRLTVVKKFGEIQ